jgi:hypothetical protein
MEKSELKTGYLLLYRIGLAKRGFRKFFSKLIGFFQPVISEGGSLKKTYSHISAVDRDINYELESTFPKAKRHLITLEKSPVKIEVYRVKRADEIETIDGVKKTRWGIALEWQEKHLGTRYDVWQLFSMGLFDAYNREVCSTFIGKSWLKAGIVFSSEGAKDHLISPNEIVFSKEVEFLGTLENT